MSRMFAVRPAQHMPCAQPMHIPHLAPHRLPSVRFSAGRHKKCIHGGGARRALRPACPAPNKSANCAPRPACRVQRGRPPLPACTSHRMLSLRLSAVRVGVQPAAKLRHVQRHRHELHVLGTLRAEPTPNLQSIPSVHSLRRAVACRPPFSRPVHRAPRIVCLSYALLLVLGRTQERSASRWISTRPASQSY